MKRETKEEFIAGYIERSKLTGEELEYWLAHETVCPCYCGDAKCRGWAVLGPRQVAFHMETDGVDPDAGDATP